MTNLKGIRHYKEFTTSKEEHGYAEKDVSGLAIIAPFSIYIRARIYKNFPSSKPEVWINFGFNYGGASDEGWNAGGMRWTDTATSYLMRWLNLNSGTWTDSNLEGIDSTNALTLNEESWVWFKLEILTDRTMYMRYKNDATITKPTSGWTTEFTTATVINATPSQELKKIRTSLIMKTSTSATTRVILEVDEIIIEQD